MKPSRLFAVALIALPLMACSFFTSAAESGAQSLSSTSVAQASTAKAAGDMYVVAEKMVHLYSTSGHASKTVMDDIAIPESQIYNALIAAKKADAAGNSPALAAALSVFNQNYASLAKLVPGL